MKYYIRLLKFYLNIISVIAPKHGGRIVFNLFQKVSLKTFKKRELPFYDDATHFKVKQNGEDLHCYEMGNPNGKLVFLVHGWNSNAGSLTKIANSLVQENYRVISFDLPGHAKAKINKTNLYICKEAFKDLIAYVNPQEAFHVVSHSFGSVVSAYSLSETDYKAEKFVILSTNNRLEDVFLYFKKIVGFNKTIYKEFTKLLEGYMNENVDEMVVSDKIKSFDFDKLLVIHDKFDKVIPFNDAKTIHQEVENSKLIPFEKIGHYRMLWNDEVVTETINFIN